MKVLSTAEKRRLEARAVEELGMPSIVLMENAAREVTDVVERDLAPGGRVCVLCGPGNNGGDGLGVARHLALRGRDVTCWLAVPADRLKGDARTQYAICRRGGVPVSEATPGEIAAWLRARVDGPDVIVDALFGTGLSRPLEGEWVELVEALDVEGREVVAVDLPSGLMGDGASPVGPFVTASRTVALAAPQPAHVLWPVRGAVGDLWVADLGLPPRLLEEAAPAFETLEPARLAALLPQRGPEAHKGTAGHLLVWAGSPGKAGAAVLAARAAGRLGAGLVSVACPETVQPTVAAGTFESMTLALPEVAEGSGDGPASLADRIVEHAGERSALAAGPGLGTNAAIQESIRAVVARCPVPMVLDADTLNAFAGRLGELADRRAPAVLTPHPGELGRLLERSAAEVQADRLAAARQAAQRSRAVVVLKGRGTLIAAPEGGVELCLEGGPALATGGSGDVLTGMIGALLAQGLEPRDAACLGVWLHARTGDRLAAQRGVLSLLAGDLVEELPASVRELEERSTWP
ncbi:MAG: NAD(P)H-hydrate dehydratase [Thermoanaerobaculia bacterium]